MRENHWKTHPGPESSGGADPLHEETAAGPVSKGMKGVSRGTRFDRPGPDIYSEGRMPEEHTSKDH